MPRDGRARTHRPDGQPVRRPTPREIRALKAVEDGSSLAVAADRLGIPRPALASVLSGLYLRLGITTRSPHRLSTDRRRMAVNICKREGWWPE